MSKKTAPEPFSGGIIFNIEDFPLPLVPMSTLATELPMNGLMRSV